jgi:peptide/nickel transport system permease protein
MADAHTAHHGPAAAFDRDTSRASALLAGFVKLISNPLRGASFVFLVLLLVVAAFAPQIAPYDPLRIDSAKILHPPSADHWLGTDDLGRDVLSRVIHGSRISLRVGVLSAGISVVLGVLFGLASGYLGGWIGFAILRAMDLLLAFPGLLLALVVVAILGPGLDNVMVAVGIGGVPMFTRVVHGTVLSTKSNDYVEASRGLGCGNARIVFRHILPNITAPIIVLATLQVGTAIFLTSSLSFIGLGAQPPQPEWGAMVSRGRHALSHAMWMSTFPGIAVAVTVITLNVLGDGLRDLLDPRMRH